MKSRQSQSGFFLQSAAEFQGCLTFVSYMRKPDNEDSQSYTEKQPLSDRRSLFRALPAEADKDLVICRVEQYPLVRRQTMKRRTEWSFHKLWVHLSRVTSQIKRR